MEGVTVAHTPTHPVQCRNVTDFPPHSGSANTNLHGKPSFVPHHKPEEYACENPLFLTDAIGPPPLAELEAELGSYSNSRRNCFYYAPIPQRVLKK